MVDKLLYRIDPARRMHRFYRLDVSLDLFGAWLCVRQWGRIGVHGRTKFESFVDRRAALLEAERVLQGKRRRGYVEVRTLAP